MKTTRDDQFIIILASIGCMGLVVESIMMGWEFWVPPLIVLGILAMWAMHITGKPEKRIREILGGSFILFQRR